MNKRFFLAFCTLSLLIISCKKDDSTPTPATTTSYLDVAAGHTWNYETTDNATSPATVSTYSLVSSASDTTINSKSYHILSRSNGGASEYRNLTGTDYYEYLTLPAILGGTRVENIYLKSSIAAGTVWSQPLPTITYSVITANVTKTDTIREKGITLTVKGIVYTDVIHVSTGFTVNSSTIPISITTDIQSYFAPKVGRISSKNVVRFVVPLGGIDQTISNKTELVNTNF